MSKFCMHNVFGLGLISKFSNSIYTTKFLDMKDRDIISDKLLFVNESFSNFIIKEEYNNFFDYSTKSKGKKYYKNDLVLSYSISDKTVSSIVKSETTNELYDTTIKFIGDSRVSFKCSCPVGNMCKHTYATLLKIKGDMDSLVFSNQTYQRKEYFNTIDNLFKLNKRDTDYKTYKDIFDAIDFNSRDELNSILSYLEKKNGYDKDKLIRLIFTKLRFDNLDINVTNPHLINIKREQIILVMSATTYKNSIFDLFDAFCLSLASGDISFFKKNTFINTQSNMSKEIEFLIDNTNINRDFIDEYFTYLSHSYSPLIYQPLTKKLMETLDNENVEYIKKKYVEYLSLSDDEILSFSSLDLLSSINNMQNKYEALKILDIAKDRLYSETKEEFIDCLFKINLIYISEKTIDILYYFSDLRPLVPLFNRSIESEKNVEESIFDLLKISYDIKIDSDYYTVILNLKLGKNYIYSVIKDDNFYKNQDKVKPYLRNTRSQFFKTFVNKVLNDTNFENDIKNADYKLEENQREEKKRILVSNLNQFEKILDQNDLILNEKIHLFPTFYLDYFYNGELNGVALELKIGTREKNYVVKSISKLIDDVECANFVKYGSKLEFEHVKENFDEISQKLLDLLAISYADTSSRTLNLKPRFFTLLFDLYKGSIVDIEFYKYNEHYLEQVLIDEDILSYKMEIDDNSIINSKYDKDDIINIDNKYYYIDLANHKISKFNLSKNENKLLEFALFNKGMDVSVVKKQFEEKVLARLENEIELSDKIKDKYKVTKLRIDAKFDISIDYLLTVNLTFYKDNEEISNPKLLSSLDMAKLEQLNNYLYNLGFKNKDIYLKNQLYCSDKDSVINFLKLDFSDLKKLCNVYLSNSILNKKITNLDSLSIKVKHNTSMFSAFMEDSIYTPDELKEIFRAIKQKKSYVLLSNDKIVDIDSSAIKIYDEFKSLGLDEKNPYEEVVIPVYKALEAYANENNINVDDYIKEIHSDIVSFKDKKIDLPEVNATLRPYQVEGFNFLSILSRHNLSGILADDMGLGKTLEIITLLSSDNTPMPSIVVCPKTLTFNWKAEIEKFGVNLSYISLNGSKGERACLISNIEYNKKVIYITSYDSLRNDIDFYKDIKFNYIILDEAQSIKNVFAKKSQSVKELNGLHRFALTGTPIENNIGDLYSIFDFLMPGLFPPIEKFMAKYEKNNEALSKVVAPFILRRTKKEVLKDLPDKIETIITCPMTENQQKVYDAYKEKARQELETAQSTMSVLPFLMRLRQICITPCLVAENENLDSGKLSELYNMIENQISEGHKILLFSTFKESLKLISSYLTDNKIEHLMLTGETSLSLREKYVADFNARDDIKVFLISLKAGGTGLNLTAADTVIHLDPWWNVSAENQATDRAYRIGQKRVVNVYKLVCQNSIEEKIIELQNAKKDIIDKVISDSDESITKFSLDDMKYILK